MSVSTSIVEPRERIEVDPNSLRRFSVAEYDRMVKTGILGADDKVELLEGWIIKKMPQNPPHIASISRIVRWFGRFLPNDWTLRVQGPITLSDSEPEPDIVLARGEMGIYDSRHPEPADIGLLLEVGDSTVIADRRYKGNLYARERIAQFWLIDLVQRKLEVFTRPRGGKYQKRVEYADNETVSLILDGGKIADVLVVELMAKS